MSSPSLVIWGRAMTGKRDAGAGSAWWKRHQAIIAAAQAAGLKRGALALLRVMLEAETGRTQTVIRSRETLAEAMGANIKTVERNMAALVEAGAVEKLYSKGGQGKANVYRLKEIHQYRPQNGVGNGDEVDYLPQNGEIPPPFCPNTSPKMGEPSYPSYLSEGERSAASRAAAGPHGPLPTPSREELALFSREHAELGIAEAMARSRARRAAAAG